MAADKKEQFKKLIKQLKKGEISDKAKEGAKELLQTIDAKTLGLIEQELIREGISHDEIRKSLCAMHLDVLKDTMVSKRVEVEAPHPVHTFMEEHKIIISTLSELRLLIDRLEKINNFETMKEDLEKLKNIAYHLVEAESHHDREEQCLFPKLEKHNISEPSKIMRMDHVEFKKRKQELYKLAHSHEDYDFGVFKEMVIALGAYLTQQLESHIFKEDNILYQIALQVLSKEEWDDVKREADKIGYCCFTPKE